jgi:putative DNA primase/helicase
VVSLPDGAPAEFKAELDLADKRFHAIETCAELLAPIKRFVLAVDNDGPGNNLAHQLMLRFGKERCFRPRWPEGCKDPNDVLVQHGPDLLHRLVEEAPSSLKANDFFQQEVEGDQQAEAPAFSEDAIAQLFTELHGNDLRYVAPWGRWLIWDGKRWAFDATVKVYDMARAVCREAAADCVNERDAKKIASARTRAAVESLVRADRHHAATVDQWDSNPGLLNTPDGVVDLKTGATGPHRREDFCSKITAIAPGGDCPRWHKFLKRVTNGNSELQSFLQRMVGYCLTGMTLEHALFFAYGIGANGKSVFTNTIAGLLGEYHTTAPMEVFMASHTDRHPTELAMFRGARLVTAVETEDGRHWAESRIKALTGGDPIAARFMRQDFFQFQPKFKLLIAGNHKPAFKNVDEAIRRRLHLIPFTVTIPEHERDDRLSEKLKREWPGILQWAIEGAVMWAKTGLTPPAAVTDATTQYLTSEDTLVAWMDDCCCVDPRQWCSSAALWESWKGWAATANEKEGSRRKFSQNLEERGFAAEKSRGVRGYRGLILKKAKDKQDCYGH